MFSLTYFTIHSLPVPSFPTLCYGFPWFTVYCWLRQCYISLQLDCPHAGTYFVGRGRGVFPLVNCLICFMLSGASEFMEGFCDILVLIDYVSRAHKIEIRPSSVARRPSSVHLWHRLSLDIWYGILSKFSCFLPWTYNPMFIDFFIFFV